MKGKNSQVLLALLSAFLTHRNMTVWTIKAWEAEQNRKPCLNNRLSAKMWHWQSFHLITHGISCCQTVKCAKCLPLKLLKDGSKCDNSKPPPFFLSNTSWKGTFWRVDCLLSLKAILIWLMECVHWSEWIQLFSALRTIRPFFIRKLNPFTSASNSIIN